MESDIHIPFNIWHMLGVLNENQMDQVLRSQLVGRVGCSANGKTLVVPLSFVYDGDFIYAHSNDGEKIKMMRRNASVCFEVDEINDLANWRSVLIQGTYEEIKDESEQQRAKDMLVNRLLPFVSSETVNREPAHARPPEIVEKKTKAVFFRIKVDSMTGRFEKSVLH